MIGETGARISDVVTGAELDQLQAHVGLLLRGHVRDFRLSAQDNGLVLHGYARTYYSKQRAQHLVLVMAKRGLVISANAIQVG